MDRIALNEEATYAPEVAAEAVKTAAQAALSLVEYDQRHRTRHGRFTPESLQGSDSASRKGYRAYVRQEYLVWSLTERS